MILMMMMTWMDGWKIPTSKSGHKVPKTFKKKNVTETVKIRKRKLPEGNRDEQRSKVGKTTSSHRKKDPDDSHSYSCNQSDLHKIQQISMSETRNLDILQQNPLRIVIINNSIKKCTGCKKLFGKKERTPQNDLVFHLCAWQSRCNEKGELVPGNAPQPTYYCAEDLACTRMQRKSIQKDDIYCGNFYFACLTPAHVKVLKQCGYWEHIKANRSTEKEHD